MCDSFELYVFKPSRVKNIRYSDAGHHNTQALRAQHITV